MSTERLAAAVISRARAETDLTTPEFDYRIGRQRPVISGILGAAAYDVANDGLDGTSDEREARWRALWDQILPELLAYQKRCENRRYLGWSKAAQAVGQHIRYDN